MRYVVYKILRFNNIRNEGKNLLLPGVLNLRLGTPLFSVMNGVFKFNIVFLSFFLVVL